MSADWVTIKKFCQETGYTPGAVYKKIERGIWLEGVIWRTAPDSRKLISMRGYHQWVEGTGCDQHQRVA